LLILLLLNLVTNSLLNLICEIYSKIISAKTCFEKIKSILLIVFFTVATPYTIEV